MALTPIKVKWSQQLITSEATSFVVETTALQHTYFIQNPVLMFHNIGDEDAELEIKYTLTINEQTDDPLNSGTYELVVVSATVGAGERYPYDFAGMQLDNNPNFSVTHTVTITNSGANTHVFHTLLFGVTEVQSQREAASVLTNTTT